jgi:hypothetical protein
MVRDSLAVSRLGLVTLGAYALFAAWTFASAFWSVDVTKSVYDGQLALLYATMLAAAVIVTEPRRVAFLLGGTLTGIAAICAYAFVSRLAIDVFGLSDVGPISGRLEAPIGYWNGLGGYAAIGVVLAVGIAASQLHLSARMAAGASLIATIPTLYLTFSRGALIGLGLAGLVLVATYPARLRLIGTCAALTPSILVALLLIRQRPELSAFLLDRARATTAGHQLLLPMAGLALASGGSVAVAGILGRRLDLSSMQRRTIGLLVGLVVMAATAGIVAARGGPVHLADSARTQAGTRQLLLSQNRANRLGSFALNGRTDQWKVAWDLFADHPILGIGAGTWEYAWVLKEPYPDYNERPHDLYVETLAELGVIGAVVLFFALFTPLFAGVRGHSNALAATALAAAVVFVVQSAVEWDWQLPAVTVPFLLCSGALLQLDPRTAVVRLGPVTRWASAAVVSCLLILTLAALQGNRLIADAANSIQHGNPGSAVSAAHSAETWMPWSYEPELLQGEAWLAAGDRVAATRVFRKAIADAPSYWRAWYDLAESTRGHDHVAATMMLRRVYPLDTDLLVLCKTVPKRLRPKCLSPTLLASFPHWRLPRRAIRRGAELAARDPRAPLATQSVAVATS